MVFESKQHVSVNGKHGRRVSRRKIEPGVDEARVDQGILGRFNGVLWRALKCSHETCYDIHYEGEMTVENIALGKSDGERSKHMSRWLFANISYSVTGSNTHLAPRPSGSTPIIFPVSSRDGNAMAECESKHLFSQRHHRVLLASHICTIPHPHVLSSLALRSRTHPF